LSISTQQRSTATSPPAGSVDGRAGRPTPDASSSRARRDWDRAQRRSRDSSIRRAARTRATSCRARCSSSPVPDRDTLAAYTKQVVANTYVSRPPAPLPPLLREHPIRHVVVHREGEPTFDQVFGGRTRRARRTPSLAELAPAAPNHTRSPIGSRSATTSTATPTSPTPVTAGWSASIRTNGGSERARAIEGAPFSSRQAGATSTGSAATVMPEDYNEAGALWEHLARNGVSFFNLGFGTEMPVSLEERLFRETGIRMTVSFPLPKPLFDRTSRRFPTFNMAIPDQYRADVFEQELRERWESGREPFPALLTMVLPQDHLTDPKPEYGYPQKASYMADNDLALGRVIETLSRSRWWSETLVVVVEDDPQGAAITSTRIAPSCCSLARTSGGATCCRR
jgi:hypothetical protein